MFAILKFALHLIFIIWHVNAEGETQVPAEVQETSTDETPVQADTQVPIEAKETPANDAPAEAEGDAPNGTTTEASPEEETTIIANFKKNTISKRVSWLRFSRAWRKKVTKRIGTSRF